MSRSSRRSRLPGWKLWLSAAVVVGAASSGISSAPAGATTPQAVPGAPKITARAPGLQSVTLTFAKPAQDGGTRVSTYLAKCTSSNGGVPGSHLGLRSPIAVVGLTSGKTYTCTVSASNKVGIGPASAPCAPVVTLPTVPGVPKITLMTSGFHKVAVSFAPTSDGGAPIQNYRVTCTIYYSTLAHQARKSPITIACAAGGETYSCTVAAENRIGWSHTSTYAHGVSLPVAPGAPTITTVTAGPHSAVVAFTPPVNDGGVRIQSYRAACTSTDGGAPNAHQAGESPVTVAGLGAGRTYTCTVAAISAVTTGPASAPSLPLVPFSP